MMPRLLFLLWTLLLMSEESAEKPQPTSSGAVDARLVNGHSHCSGHLEMKHQGQWRTLTTSSSLSIAMGDFSEIACRQMGCGSVVSFKLHPNTTVSTPAWEMPFSCLVSDLTLRECIKKARRNKVDDVQSALTSTYVECSDSLRVTDEAPFSFCSGTVTVKSGQNWIHVCETETPKNEEQFVKLVCAELGCGSPKRTQHISTEAGVESRIIQCHGNETQLEQCPASAHSNCTKVLRIECEESYFFPDKSHMRLVGESRCRGVLEGKSRLQWRPFTIGSYPIEEEALMYLCRILDCGTLISSTNLNLSRNVPLWDMTCDSVNCKLWLDKHGQSVMNIACTESVRQYDHCSGHVEIKHKDEWHHLCHNGFSLRHSFVGCRDLGCGFPQSFRSGRNVSNALSLNCSGHEEHLTDCPVSSLPAGGADDECEAAVLFCGKTPSLPEVTMFSRLADVQPKALIAYDGHQVRVICNNDSPIQVKSFVLTFSSKNVTELKGNQFAVDNAAQFVFEAELNQNGSYHCSYNYEFSPDVFSDHTEFHLRVKESLYARLSGREGRCLGSLELEHEGEWRAVSQEQWGLEEAAVVCRQLHCGSAISTDTQSGELQPVWRFYSDCDGSERALLDCGSVRKWMSSTTVHVLCSDIVAPPNIAVLADRAYPENTEQVVVHEGHSFFVNCSVEPRFPRGHFSLIFSGSKVLSPNEAANDHSAVFKFSKVCKVMSGNYSCVYQNTVSQHRFTFESKTITITVEESGDIKLDDGLQRDDGSKSCSGTLFMKNRMSQMKMVSMETSAWDMRHASIVCRQLGCSDAVSTSKLQLRTFISMWRFFSDCDGSEAALLDCGHIDESFSSTAVQVVCDDYTKKIVNLAFLFDGSGSMTPADFEMNKIFIGNVMSNLKNTSIKFAAIQFSHEVKTVFTFNDYTNGDADSLLKKEQQFGSLTNTHKALDFVLREHFENPEKGSSPEATKVLVLITDGDPSDSNRKKIIEKYEEKKIIRFVIGVRDVNLGKMREIVSEPKDHNTFRIQNYNELTGILENLQKKIFQSMTLKCA